MPDVRSRSQQVERQGIGAIGWVIVALVTLAWGALTLRLPDLVLSTIVAMGGWLALLVGRAGLATTQAAPWIRGLVRGAGIVALFNVAALAFILIALANRTGP